MREARRDNNCCWAHIRRLERQVGAGKVEMFPRTEMLDLVVIDGKARGIVTRNLMTGEIESHAADAVLLCTGGYGNVFFLSTNAKGSNCNRDLARAQEGRAVCQSRASRRSTRPAFLFQATINRSSPSCRSRFATTAAYGCLSKKVTIARPSDPRSRARLLSGAPVSQLRQSRAARRGFSCRESCM